MLDNNSNGDGVEIEGVEVQGMEVVWIGVGVGCTDCAVLVGVVETIDLGSDTMKDLELARVYNNGRNKNKQWEREREREREVFGENSKNMYFTSLI